LFFAVASLLLTVCAVDRRRSGATPLVVATDVAGRGLHVQGLAHVLNYDFPPSIAAYEHRVGRVARAGEVRALVAVYTAAARHSLTLLNRSIRPAPLTRSFLSRWRCRRPI